MPQDACYQCLSTQGFALWMFHNMKRKPTGSTHSIFGRPLLLSAIEMLKYIGENNYAEKIEKALFKTLSEGSKTADLGGTLSTTEFTDKIIKNLG